MIKEGKMEIYTTVVSGKIFKIKSPIISTQCTRNTCINKFCDNFKKKLDGLYCNKCRGMLKKKKLSADFTIPEILESALSESSREDVQFMYVKDIGALFAIDMVQQGSKRILEHKNMENSKDHIKLKEILIEYSIPHEEMEASFGFIECCGDAVHKN